MAEWLTLVLVVPAVIVPVILLAGFAGCDDVFNLHRPDVPSIVSAEARGASVIRLTWTYSQDPPATEFEFERTKLLDQQDLHTFKASSSPYDDNNAGLGLDERTVYNYRIRAIYSDGETGAWSDFVMGTTLAFATIFSWTPQEQAIAEDNVGWENYCLVQRIEVTRLAQPSFSGTQVRLTLRASLADDASIESLFISKPDPQPGRDPYDSDIDLTPVIASKVVIPANNSVPIPAINYVLDPTRPLLLIFAFSAAPPSGIKAVQVPGTDASAYFKQSTDEAPKTDRASDFTQATQGLFFVEKIEIG
jgi:hypothetical protein